MVQITGLTSSPSQTFNIPEPITRKTIYFSLYFSPRTQNWYTDIEYESFTARSIKLVRGPNIISRHRNTIPFGISVVVSDNFEPFLINDFSSGRVSLYLLNQSDVEEIDGMIVSGATVP